MTPDGYERCSVGASTALGVSSAVDWLGQVLDSGSTLHEWAARQPGAVALRGRGTVYAVARQAVGPDARARWAVRHYRRGGALAGYLDDRYLLGAATRPEQELLVSVAARARGIPTPAVVAAAWYRSGAFYRADLVTELVPDVIDLADALFAVERGEEAVRDLEPVGRLVRRMAAKGIRHADLNAMNIMVGARASESDPFVIDLDRATVTDEEEPGSAEAMLRRLERSLRKLGERCGRALPTDGWAALRAGFEGEGA